MKVLSAILLSAFSVLLMAQNANQDRTPPVPTITYDSYWQAARPQNVTITVKSDGATTYLSRNPDAPAGADRAQDPDYHVDFTMSPVNRNKLFQLAEKANYFHGDFDFRKHAMANTGRKTLTYADIQRHFQTVYNYSDNQAIQEITAIFQNIATTMEHGRKMAFMHKYDKLGLDAELKAADSDAQSHQLAEVRAIAPVLQSIADDPTVLNIARQRARHILKMAK
jgi:hypothetical protein